MSLRNLATRIAPTVRSIHTSAAVRGGHHDTRGVFGSNVPFPVHNRYLLLGIFMVYFSSGLALPFLSMRSLVLAKSSV